MKLLLAYDGFEHSLPALEETARLARTEGAIVTIASVVPLDAQASKAGGHVGMAPHAHQDVARAHAYLRERGLEAEMEIAHGEPVERLVEIARTGGFDVIVTGTRGRGPVARLLLGSVSHRLAESAPCAVLVVGEDRMVRVEPRASA